MTFVTQIGFLLKKHQRIISIIQWCMVFFYFFLLLAPAISPFLGIAPSFSKNLHIFSVFIFWGFGWPLILLSTMLFGRIWCGLFCPDGTLTETISCYGKQQSIPRWIRWVGWPKLTFLIFSFSVFFSDAIYQYTSTSILLGFFTLFALLIGFLYGNRRRVWCMYLCPSNIIFSFLAKLSFIYFQVDKEKWSSYKGPTERINCAPLINIKQMESTSFCHACGRCNNYRNAVKTEIRVFDHEILSTPSKQTSTIQSLTLLFGLIGLGTTFFLLSLPFFKNVIPNNLFFYFGTTLIGSFLIGSFFWGSIWLSWKICGSRNISWQQLSLGLIPLAGVGLLLGFTPIAFQLIQAAIWIQNGLYALQQLLVLIASLLSIWLGWKLLPQDNESKHITSMIVYGIATIMLAMTWSTGFWMQIQSL